MASFRPLVVGFAIVMAAFAGCFGGEEAPNQRSVSASGGRASDGWAYDGVGLADAGAELTASFLNAENQGSAVATFRLAGSEWRIDFSQFAEAEGRAFMDGGIAFDLVEHGDSGVADKSIPRIHALVAAWGTATVTRDGQPVTGSQNQTAWPAHVMVSRTTVRGSDGRIATADGSGPYSPDAPADARTVDGDVQVFLWVKSPDGEDARRAPATGSESSSCVGPDCGLSFDVPAEKGAATLVTVNLTPPSGAPVGAAQATVTLEGPDGAPLGSREVQMTPAAPAASAAFDLPADQVAGTLRVVVRGAGAFDVQTSWTVAFDDHPFIVLTWDEATVS